MRKVARRDREILEIGETQTVRLSFAQLTWGAIVLCVLSIPAAAAALPDCAGTIEVADAPIVRAERNGVLVVSDGRAVKVEGLLLPQGSRDHAPGFLADQAISTLNDFARGHRATLAVHVPKEDRYDRVRG